MNDKRFVRAKVMKSLKKMLCMKHVSGHKLSRLNVLGSMVASILFTGRCELSRMASGNPDRKQLQSKRKQYKRLLLNERMGHGTHFLPFAMSVLRNLAGSGMLVFSIDGSEVGNGCMCLMFSVIYKGRAIPVVWKCYKRKKGHLPESEHRALLAELEGMVPEGCRVVVTGDGEFDGCSWMSDLEGLGWEYVLKTSRNTLVEDDNGEVSTTGGTIPPECGDSLFLEGIKLTAARHRTNLLAWHRKDCKSPLYLVTNMDYAPQIKQFYKKRFKIETFFRDQKSGGFHIHKSGLSCPKRLDRLLVATCLAYALCIMAGIKSCKSKFYEEFCRTDGDWYSLFHKGYLFILFLVDIRQWREFSVSHDMPPEQNQLGNMEICVPY